MTEALVQALAIAAAGILSPGSMLIALLLLAAAGGLKKALAYYTGYFGTYVGVGTAAVLIAGRVQPSESGGIGPWLYSAVGSILLVLAFRKWRAPIDDGASGLPGIFAKIDSMTAPKLIGLGGLVACLNFKNMSIFLSAIAAIIAARLPPAEAIPSAVAVAFVFCLAVLGPILLFIAGGKSAKPVLEGLKASLERNSRMVTLVLLVVFGGLMLARGIHGLAG